MIAFYKIEYCGLANIKLKLIKNLELHAEHLFFVIGICCNIDVFTDLLHWHFLVFGCDEKRCDAKQLEVVSGDLLLFAKAINYVYRNVKSLGLKLKLQVNLNQP